MKKIVLALVAVVMLGSTAFSQVSLGGRFYGGLNSGAEVSLLYDMSQTNRIEADLGVGYGVVTAHYHDALLGDYTADHVVYLATASGSYQWMFNIIKGFGWFVGPAAQFGIGTHPNNDLYARLGIGAQGGVEYKFDFPLQVSLDVRPMIDLFHLADPHGLFHLGVAAGVRDRF